MTRVDAGWVAAARSFAANYVKYGSLDGTPAPDAQKVDLRKAADVDGAYMGLADKVRTSWNTSTGDEFALLLALLELAPASARARHLAELRPAKRGVPASLAEVRYDLSRSDKAALADLAAQRGLWAGSEAPVRPTSQRKRLTPERMEKVRREVDAYLATGRRAVESVDQFISVYKTLVAKHKRTATFSPVGLALAISEHAPAKLRARLRKALDNDELPAAAIVGTRATLHIEKGEAGITDLRNYLAKRLEPAAKSSSTKYELSVKQVGESLGAALEESFFSPSWKELLDLYGAPGVLGEVREPSDFDQIPRNRGDVRAVWIPSLGVLRWATDDGGIHTGGNHDHLGRGEGGVGARQGYIHIDDAGHFTIT